MTNQFSHIRFYVMVSGRKKWPWVVMWTRGEALGYFKNRKDAERYCATDAQAFA